MTEKLFQYLWNYKIFSHFNFKDTEGNKVEIIDFGKWNHNSGPDFLMAKIRIRNITIVGNIELHLKSSDWIFHGHTGNPEFSNVILHVVYHHDTEIPELTKRNIPTLELDNQIDEAVLWKYELLEKQNIFIPCEKIFEKEKVPLHFFEETLLKKLDEKSIEIEKLLLRYNNNYEQALFINLAYAFGLKVNAQIFSELAENIDFSILQKIRQHPTQLEALFFGKAGWLEKAEDEPMKIWKQEYEFLIKKFKMNKEVFRPKFLRLRPPNFPTIRLSQLANLYHREPNLFSKLIETRNNNACYSLFENTKASEYWDLHYNFGKVSPVVQEKTITKEFIEILMLNVVLPLKYAYHKNHQEEATEQILDFYRELPPEKNSIINGWQSIGNKVNSALESQALLYQYKTFCSQKLCLNCSIGFQLLKQSNI